MAGYIYCLTNEAIPGLVKIGKTARDPITRAAEISASTGVPTPFDIVWSREVPNMDKAEADLHAALAEHRHTKRREFFRCTPETAMARAKKLSSFGVAKPNTKKDRRRSDFAHGWMLTAATIAIFGSAVAFDLDLNTVGKAVAGLAVALTLIFQSAPLISAIRQ